VVDSEVARLVNEAHERAVVILTKDRDLLDRLSQVLIAREVMEGKDLKAYVEGTVPIPTPDDLKLELDQKAAENGQVTDEVKPGPAIIPSAPPTGFGQEIPARPD
jgi:cell division protease FtsH